MLASLSQLPRHGTALLLSRSLFPIRLSINICWIVRDVQSGSEVARNGRDLLRNGRDLTTKVGEQPWPQLMRCASIDCRACGCIFQED